MTKPSTITLTDKTPTLAELETYRADWLAEAVENGNIDKLFTIATNLAVNVRRDHRPKAGLRGCQLDHDLTLLYKTDVWCENGITQLSKTIHRIRVYKGEPFLKDTMEYELIYRPIPGLRLVTLFLKDNGSLWDPIPLFSNAQNVYLPGKWEQALIPAYNKAINASAKRDEETEMQQRDRLAQELLIGKEI